MGSSRTSQFGLAAETTPGLYVTPSTFIPVTSFDYAYEDGQTSSEAIVTGLRGLQEWQSNGGNVAVSANLGFELTARGVGGLIAAAIGPNNVTTNGPTSNYYDHTIVTGSQDGKAQTWQAGIADDAGTVQPITLTGVKVKTLSLAWDEGSKVNGTAGAVAQRVDQGTRTLTSCATTDESATVTVTSATADMEGQTISGTGIPSGSYIVAVNSATEVVISQAATANGTGLSLVVGRPLASASYTTTNQHLFKAHHCTVSVAGSEVPMYGGSWQITKPIPDTEFFAGSRWSAEQKDTGELDDISGTFDCEFNAALYDRFRRGEKFTVVQSFVNGSDSLTLTSRARITPGAEPKIDGRSRNRMSVSWMALGDTNGDLLTAVINTRDATLPV